MNIECIKIDLYSFICFLSQSSYTSKTLVVKLHFDGFLLIFNYSQ